MKCKVRSGKNTQFLGLRSGDFLKPAIGSRRMHRVAVTVTKVANGANIQSGVKLVLNFSDNFNFD